MIQSLILVRHSLPEIKQDLPAREWNLSEEGRTRAARLAESLKRYQPDLLFSSPEPKASETAEIISGKLLVPIRLIQDLHEHERSKVSYVSRTAFNQVVREFFEKPDRLVFGSETANEAYGRFSRAVYTILTENNAHTATIVSHGTVISLFVARLTGRPPFEIWSEIGLPGMIVLDIQSNKVMAFENNF